MNDSILQFCKSDTRVKEYRKAHHDEHRERLAAQRSLGSVLQERMTSHSVTSVQVAEGRFVRVNAPPPRLARIASVDEAMELGTFPNGVPRDPEKIPSFVVQEMTRRLRARPSTEVRPARLQVVARAGRTRPVESPPAEVLRLAKTYVAACDDRKEQREQFRPLRDEKRRVEEELLQRMREPVVVQMAHGGGKSTKFRVSREEVVPKDSESIGVRDFLRLVREAAAEVSRHAPQDFDRAFREALRRRLGARPPRDTKQRITIRRC